MNRIRRSLTALLMLAAATAFLPFASAQTVHEEDEVFRLVETETGQMNIEYQWGDPAIVYDVNVEPGDVVNPGDLLCTLKIKQKSETTRSNAHLRAGATYLIRNVNIKVGLPVHKDGEPLFQVERRWLAHDSSVPTPPRKLEMKQLFDNLWRGTGLREFIVLTKADWTLGLGRLIMIVVGLVLLYLAIVRRFEPLLLVPIGFGTILVNIPLAGLGGPDGILGYLYHVGIETGIFP